MLHLAVPAFVGELPRSGLSVRDRLILRLAQQKLRGRGVDFALVIDALQEAVKESIPDGRIFLLGHAENGPILGSIISGIGITADPTGVQLVRVARDGQKLRLGRFLP